jgi:hypothetical protein
MAAESTPSTSFSDKFLHEYASLSANMFDAYRQLFVKADSGANTVSYDDINLIKDKITVLAQKELSLSLPTNPTESIQKLKTAINS